MIWKEQSRYFILMQGDLAGRGGKHKKEEDIFKSAL